jgi:hypothetical protein
VVAAAGQSSSRVLVYLFWLTRTDSWSRSNTPQNLPIGHRYALGLSGRRRLPIRCNVRVAP